MRGRRAVISPFSAGEPDRRARDPQPDLDLGTERARGERGARRSSVRNGSRLWPPSKRTSWRQQAGGSCRCESPSQGNYVSGRAASPGPARSRDRRPPPRPSPRPPPLRSRQARRPRRASRGGGRRATSIVAAAQRRAVAAHHEAVRRSPRCPPPGRAAPRPRRAIRSDSLKRSSSAPRDHGLALGERAQQRHQRQLVDRERHLVGLDHGGLERPEATSSSPTGSSSASVPGSSRSPTITAPMRWAMRKKPVRVQLRPTSRDNHARSGHERRPRPP